MAVSSVSFQVNNVSMEDLLNESEVFTNSSKPGSIVMGKVAGFNKDSGNEYVIVSMGTKSEGRIDVSELDHKPEIGSDIEAMVISTDHESGMIRLSRRELEAQRGWDVVKESYEKDLPVSGIVRSQGNRGYNVNVSGLNLFLPHSHLGSLIQGSDRGRKSAVIGSTYMFKILELDSRKKSGIVSRKVFMEGENSEKWTKFLEKHKINDIVTGHVVKHINIGAFIEVDGVLGFLHKSNISWERLNGDFKNLLPVGEDRQMRIIEIDSDNHRLSMGLKQLSEDPWAAVGQRFKKNDVVKGSVTFLANYGAFVDLGGGIEGLLHVSEMSWTRKINHAGEILKKNQEVETKVLNVDPEKKKIALGLKQLFSNPWDDLKNSVKIGDVMKVKVADVTNFGVFVKITDDIDGLIRKEDISWEEPAVDPRKNFKTGDEVEVKVVEMNFEEKKIGCSIRHLLPNPYKKLKNKYGKGSIIKGQVTGIVDFGIFVKIDNELEGLVHLSAMTEEESAGYKKMYKKGDSLTVVLRSVDPESRKISLSTKDVQRAIDREEIESYIDQNENYLPTSSPFSNLKTVITSNQ
ncbi:MAG: S1 RNA-binding domain-containing protein [Spirochaetia bacterium]|nr:S1 RNA-binding domain-containing protein [Spirochaetia bacterium]